MKQLLQRGDNYRWDLTGIEFAIKERVGMPSRFIGRVAEMEYLYGWAGRIKQELSRGLAFLGWRKVGKSLMLERLYNILYSEQRGLIPFYYEFTEGGRTGKEFYQDFVIRFYMQVVGYYTRDITWIRSAVHRDKRIAAVGQLVDKITPLTFQNKDQVLAGLTGSLNMLQREQPAYEYVLAAVAAPHGFATTPGVADRVVQMLDEFQYLNMYIDAGTKAKPCMAYMSTAESRVAPLLITGSLMGVVSEELMRWLPQRFGEVAVPKMNAAEAQAMTLNYGAAYNYPLTAEMAAYIVYITNGVPGRIVALLTPRLGKPALDSLAAVDRALQYEVAEGVIKQDWDDYLVLAMQALNDANMRRMTYFLCKREGEWYTPAAIQAALGLDLPHAQLQLELELLYKYDIIAKQRGRYGGVFDRTLRKVLLTNYRDLFDLPVAEFDAYFKTDNMLDYLQERVTQLELSLAEARKLRDTLAQLRGAHNNLKGHYYEREVLLTLIQQLIDGHGGLVADINVTAFTATLNYHLTSGEEIDIVLAGETVVIMIECKHYARANLDRLTPTMVDDFVDKATRLHQAHFPDSELRLGFFSKYGVEAALAQYVSAQGLHLTPDAG